MDTLKHITAKQWRNKDRYGEVDFQRQRLYDAQHAVKNAMMEQAKKKGKKVFFDTAMQIQLFVNKLVASKWFKRRWPEVKHIQVRIPRREGKDVKAKGHRSLYYIIMPKHAYNLRIVCHEIAHTVNRLGYGSGHGRYYARCYLELVRHLMGYEAFLILRDSFKVYRVKYNPRRNVTKKLLSPAALQRKREAAACAREHIGKNKKGRIVK